MATPKTKPRPNLGRYMAYRVAAWIAANPDKLQDDLAALLGLDKGAVSHLKRGTYDSQPRAMLLSKHLGPKPLEAFFELAGKWAQEFPRWQPGEPIPDPPPYVSTSTEDRWAEMAQSFPAMLMSAGHAAMHMLDDVTEDMVQVSMQMAWKENRDVDSVKPLTKQQWLGAIEHHVLKIQAGSGVRDSSSKQKASAKIVR